MTRRTERSIEELYRDDSERADAEAFGRVIAEPPRRYCSAYKIVVANHIDISKYYFQCLRVVGMQAMGAIKHKTM